MFEYHVVLLLGSPQLPLSYLIMPAELGCLQALWFVFIIFLLEDQPIFFVIVEVDEYFRQCPLAILDSVAALGYLVTVSLAGVPVATLQ